MKKIEKTAIVLITLYVVSIFTKTVGSQLAFNHSLREQNPNLTIYLTIPLLVVMLVFNTALAIWIFRTAKIEESKTPWVWALFSFVFGVPGAILFYVMMIYESLKTKKESEPAG